MSDIFRRRVAVLEFPFLAGAGLAGFLLTQAIGIVRNPGMVPEPGLNKALIMCTLCAVATYLGWRQRIPRAWIARPPAAAPPRAVYSLGLLLLAVGLWGFSKLTALSGGVAQHFSVPDGDGLTWTGLPVVYSFFAQYMTAGLALCTLTAFLLKNNWRLLPPAVVVVINLAAIVFSGRRSVLVGLLVFLGCAAYFGKRWLPPRALLLCAVPLLALAMFVAPEYRKHSQIGGDRDRIGDISLSGTTRYVLDGSPSEFWALCYNVAIIDQNSTYQYGAGFYNRFISYFVPKLLVGADRKAALFISVGPPPDAGNAYGWEMPTGMVATGPGTAFAEFGFFGCLCFYALARFMRYLWTRAATARDLFAQAGYTLAITAAVASLTNDMYGIYGFLFTFWLPLLVLQKLDVLRAGRRLIPAGRPGAATRLQNRPPLVQSTNPTRQS